MKKFSEYTHDNEAINEASEMYLVTKDNYGFKEVMTTDGTGWFGEVEYKDEDGSIQSSRVFTERDEKNIRSLKPIKAVDGNDQKFVNIEVEDIKMIWVRLK